jgi:membrane-associated phospholipid phosphatase
VCGCRRLRRLALGSAVAYALVAVLVATGAFSGLDGWAASHAMPFAGAEASRPTLVDGLVPLHGIDLSGIGDTVAAVVTLPGQVLISALAAALAWLELRRRRRSATAVAWGAALVLATVIEIVGKESLTRPRLHRGATELVGFDSSWPSGHAVRAAILALTLAAAWPRLRPLLALWLVAALVLLELSGAHTPSDILGGLLLAALLAAGAKLAESSALLRGRARTGGGRAPRRRRGAAA